MFSPSRYRSRRAIWLLALLALAAYREDRPTQELRRLFPDLSSEMASHLVHDDTEQFEQFAARKSHYALLVAFWCLIQEQPTSSLSEFLHAEAVTKPHVRKLLDALNRPHMFNLARVFHDAYSRRSPDDRLEIIRIQQAVGDLEMDTTSVETQAETILRLIERAESYPDVLNVAHLYGRYAMLLPHLDREDETPHYFQLGIEAALAYGDTNMTCYLLGSLGTHYRNAGQYEAMRRSWDRALALARAIGSWHEARILAFYSHHYRSQGQLAIARDLVLEAHNRSRMHGREIFEHRFAIDALRFFAKLDCWDEVGRGLRRTEAVFQEGRSQLSRADAELEDTRLQALQARYCAATGRCEEAKKLARAVVKHVDRWSLGPTRGALIHLDAARALATCGPTPEVRRVLEQGLDQCVKAPVPELLGSYAIELAQVCLQLGDLEACQRALDIRPRWPDPLESVRSGVLQLRLAMLRNDRPGAFARLQGALELFDQMERGLGASPETYIAVAQADELRRLGHELLDGSAAAGYAFEMQWRQHLGIGARLSDAVGSEPAFTSTLAMETARVRRRLAAGNAVHCLYDVRETGVVRFTVDGSGIRKEWLDCSPSELETLVERVCATLSAPSLRSHSFDARQAEDLRQLATWLLPDSLRQSPRHRLLLVTASGYLSRLRFEALNIGTQGYIPLLDRVDVASIRHWRDNDGTPGDSALVVSDPVYSPSLRRRYSILTEMLPATATEAATARRLLPRSVGLSGPAATKRNIVARWRRARVVYFAGHSIQDPELPYVMFIPVSESPDGDEGNSYLEVADLRNADLSGCQLVVLSSCASGAPYLDGSVEVPGLADVFVDAGAGAAVSTGWTVRDDDAARIMTSFLHLYAAGNDPVTALCRARRAIAAVAPDPHVWAAYSITLGALPVPDIGPVANAGPGQGSPP